MALCGRESGTALYSLQSGFKLSPLFHTHLLDERLPSMNQAQAGCPEKRRRKDTAPKHKLL